MILEAGCDNGGEGEGDTGDVGVIKKAKEPEDGKRCEGDRVQGHLEQAEWGRDALVEAGEAGY